MTAEAATVLQLPEPCLVVLVGAAGSGKTTLARRLFTPEQVLSSDAYRGMLAGDEGDQSVTRVAFKALHRDLERRLAAGLTTVVDATNVTAFARRSVVRIAERHDVPAFAIVLDLPADVVLARNATRPGRTVPEAAVRRQLADLARSLRGGALDAEGFVAIYRLRSPDDLDRVALPDGPGRSVAAGYDEIVDRYLAWAGSVAGDPRERMLRVFTSQLPAGGRVLDLGCGSGVPSTRELARTFEVTGIDSSARQIERARSNVPGATFLVADFSQIELSDASFDGVVALYSISHVPREEHARLFARIARWLVPGGLFLAALGAADSRAWTGDWLGVPMFFSSHDAAGNRALLHAAGFGLLVDEIVEMREPEGPVAFLWVIARKPRADSRPAPRGPYDPSDLRARRGP